MNVDGSMDKCSPKRLKDGIGQNFGIASCHPFTQWHSTLRTVLVGPAKVEAAAVHKKTGAVPRGPAKVEAAEAHE